MFKINDDLSIFITRGDMAYFRVSAKNKDGNAYQFKTDNVVRIKVFEKKACHCVVMQKDFQVEADTDKVAVVLNKEDTKIGEVISKPVDYWYEVELNPDTNPQTIVGYDDDGPKLFRLFPEGSDK